MTYDIGFLLDLENRKRCRQGFAFNVRGLKVHSDFSPSSLANFE